MHQHVRGCGLAATGIAQQHGAVDNARAMQQRQDLDLLIPRIGSRQFGGLGAYLAKPEAELPVREDQYSLRWCLQRAPIGATVTDNR
jgi:hypothetical protein